MKKFANILFRYREYTPIPFIVLMFIFFNATLISLIVGTFIFVLGEGLRIWGVSYAGGMTRTTLRLRADILITDGPFAYIRNPLYAGNIIIFLGFGIFSMALFPYLLIITLIWAIFQYGMIILIEEEFLEKKFGEEYLKYKANVPRFFPKIGSLYNSKQNKAMPNYHIGLRSEIRTFQAIFSVLIISLIIYLVN